MNLFKQLALWMAPKFYTTVRPAPQNSGIRFEQRTDGSTALHLEADHLVLDADRIDIAPSDSPRRVVNPLPMTRNLLPKTLSRWNLETKPPAVIRLQQRRHKQVWLQHVAESRRAAFKEHQEMLRRIESHEK